MFPVGTIIPYAGDLSKIPYGWHVCDGTNGTPDLSNRFLEGTTATPKTFKDAGLPNITGDGGNVQHILAEVDQQFGALFTKFTGESGFDAKFHLNGYGYGNGAGKILLDASRSNPIYGNSETVQPKSYTVYYIMRVK